MHCPNQSYLGLWLGCGSWHYDDVIMGAMASQITSLTIVYSTVYSDADQRKHQSSASLAILRGIHRGPVNSPHKWPVTWKMFPFHDVIITPGNLIARSRQKFTRSRHKPPVLAKKHPFSVKSTRSQYNSPVIRTLFSPSKLMWPRKNKLLSK